MSGICGILRLDGGPPAGIEAMAARLKRRGPEGTRLFRDGPCALGHTLLATTPEALVERQPFTHAPTGCTITADLRLDNRDELIPALGLSGQGRVIGDAEIVLLAWLRWGEECATHLLGDFAFAIWDPRSRRLVCARDQMGMKQLIWTHVPGRLFAFASAPSAVLEAEGVPRKINEGRIADFLENYLEGIDLTSTFFDGVSRLPPAHCFSLDVNGLRISRYWTLTPGPMLKLDGDEAYAAAFLEVFTEAVRCRLRAPAATVGSMLSGGMDSGSVVAVATRLLAAEERGPLPTFSAVGPDPEECVETRTIHAALTMPGLEPHLVDWSKPDNWRAAVIDAWRRQEEPFDTHMNLLRAVYHKAQSRGMRVVLDGVGGDNMLDPRSYLVRMIRRGHVRRAWQCAKGESAFWGPPPTPQKIYRRALRSAVIPDALRLARRRWREFRPEKYENELIDPAFAARIDLQGRIRMFERLSDPRLRSYEQERADNIRHNFLVVGRERYDRVASEASLEPRDPFCDRRMAEFCVRLPPEQLGGNGWYKYILRMAVEGLAPDEVRWRKGKTHLGMRFTNVVRSGLGDSGDADQDLEKKFAHYVNNSEVDDGLLSGMDLNSQLVVNAGRRLLRQLQPIREGE